MSRLQLRRVDERPALARLGSEAGMTAAGLGHHGHAIYRPSGGKMAMGRVHVSAARKAAILKKEAEEAKEAGKKKKAKKNK